MGSITLETFGLSDIGKAREMNEDALLVDDKHQVSRLQTDSEACPAAPWPAALPFSTSSNR